jgi:hypothetical protein
MVVWKPAAERKLAALWVATKNRKTMTDAANRIDFLLKHRPETVGESRDKKSPGTP